MSMGKFHFTETHFTVEIGEKIRQKRIQRKLSREALAKRIGVHRNTIWRWEDGDTPITLWNFLELCYALSIPHTMMLPNRSLTETQVRKQVQSERDPELRRADLLKELGYHGNSTAAQRMKGNGA